MKHEQAAEHLEELGPIDIENLAAGRITQLALFCAMQRIQKSLGRVPLPSSPTSEVIPSDMHLLADVLNDMLEAARLQQRYENAEQSCWLPVTEYMPPSDKPVPVITKDKPTVWTVGRYIAGGDLWLDVFTEKHIRVAKWMRITAPAS